MGVDPTIWGPHMWTMIHIICLHAPVKIDTNVRNSYYMFFSMMPYALPCDKCRDHWLQHIHKYPLENALHSRDSLFRWSVNMHNLVNKSLGKKEISYDDAYSYWSNTNNIKNKGCKNNEKITEGFVNLSLSKINYNYMLIVIVIILLLIVGMKL